VLEFYNNLWGDRNRIRIGLWLSYRSARLYRLAELIPGLLKSLKLPSQLFKLLIYMSLAPVIMYSYLCQSSTCAKVGGAGVDESILGVQHEILPRLFLHALPDGLDER
jgi:hypothetical protein